MSACPKIDYVEHDLAVEEVMGTGQQVVRRGLRLAPWWHGAIHLAALLSFFGLCVFLSAIGLLWFALAIEPG